MRRAIGIARHEAAHAVVAEHLGWPVTRVEIRKRKNSLGGCDHARSKNPCLFELALISLAGCAAEHKWNRIPLSQFSEGDLNKVYWLGFGNRAASTLILHARGLVEDLAVPILAVAQELKKRDLTGKDVRRIIAAAKYAPKAKALNQPRRGAGRPKR